MRSCGLSADGTRLWGAPARGAPRSRAPECPAQPRHASHASRRPAPATIGPQPKLPSSRRAGGRKTWHACTSLGGQHHVNVAAVEPPPHSTAEPPASEDAQDEVADGEIVSEVADRDSLERIYALSAAEVGVDLASLDSLLEQVEQLGQQASTAASDAMLIPDILSEAKEASAALNTRARPASTKPKTTSCAPAAPSQLRAVLCLAILLVLRAAWRRGTFTRALRVLDCGALRAVCAVPVLIACACAYLHTRAALV